MVIAMITMRMMQMAVDQVIDVIAVRYRFVSASGTVDVSRLVAAATVVRCASFRIFRANLQPVLVDVITMWMVQMTIMQIIDVIAVPDSSMAAVGTMLVVMVCMMRFVASRHSDAPRFTGYCQRAGGVQPGPTM